MKTDLKLKNFTPVIDELVATEGLQYATVFGVMWRFSNMSDGVCNASQELIAARSGVSRGTVSKCIKRAVELGHVADLTAGLVNHPHTYKVMDIVLVGEMTAELGCSNLNSEDAGCSNLNSGCTKTSNQLLDFEQEETYKKHSKKQIEDEFSKDPPPPATGLTPAQKWMEKVKREKAGNKEVLGWIHLGADAAAAAKAGEEALQKFEQIFKKDFERTRRMESFGRWLAEQEANGKTIEKFREWFLLPENEFQLGLTVNWNQRNVEDNVKNRWKIVFDNNTLGEYHGTVG